MPLSVGEAAPDFSLLDQDGSPVTLDGLRGHKSLVVFIPFPFTATCQAELCSIRDNLVELNQLDANVASITCDTRHVHKKWSDEQGFTFPILSDFWPHGATARRYGVFNEDRGCANRVTFVLDADTVIRDVIDSGSLSVAREIEHYKEALARI